MTNAPLLQVQRVSRRFGGVTALDDVSFTVARSQLVGLIGPNGAGKTTLINVVSGAERPSSGSIEYAGHADGPWPLEKSVDRGIVRTFQTPRAFAGLTVAENLRIAKSSPSASATSATVAPSVLREIEAGLERWRGQRVSDLPFGVVRRLSIAMALCTNPTLLLMDEPCVGLTSDEVDGLAGIIRSLCDHGLTVLLVEHNMSFVMALVSQIVVLHKGAVLFDGSTEDCRKSQRVQDVYLGRAA